jgi:putative transposase
MNKEWFTVQEISAALDITTVAVRKKSQTEQWQSRERQTGKGLEFHISNFSPRIARQLVIEEIQDSPGELAARQLIQEMEKVEERKRQVVSKQTTESLIAFNALPIEQKDIAFAKMEIVKARDEYLKPFISSKTLTQGHQQFYTKYNNHTLDINTEVYQLVKKITRPTVDRWQSLLNNEGITALTRKKSPRRGDCTIARQPDLEKFCSALLVANPHFKTQPSKLAEYTKVQAKKLGVDWVVPSPSSFRRWVNQWVENNYAKWVFSTDHATYFGKERPLIHDHEPWVSMPNDMWELDSTPTDVMLNVNGKLTRYAIVACIDVFTKRVKMLLSPSSTSDAIALLMRKVILDWGLLNDRGLVRTDNGADYVAKRTVAIFDHLGAKQSRAEPFSGWQKPFIERFFGTFQGGIVELLPTYIGHNVSDREKIEACHAFADRIGAGRKKRFEDALELAMTPSEFQEFMDDWLDHYYNHKSHSGNDGLSPIEMYIESDYKPRYVENERALDTLLNYAGQASVRRGRIQINKLKYSAPELQEEVWTRKPVEVFLDPTDVAKAYLYPVGEWGQCIIAVNVDLIGRQITPEQYSQKRRETEKSLRAFKRDMKRYSEEFGISGLAAEAIAQAKAHNNLTMIPKSGEAHENAALAALQNAAQTKDGTWSAAELEAIEKQRERRAQAKQKTAEQEARMLKSEREVAWDMADILVNGGELEERQRKWFDTYLRTHTLTAPKIKQYIESGGKTRRMVR